jgi:hypothetical protein
VRLDSAKASNQLRAEFGRRIRGIRYMFGKMHVEYLIVVEHSSTIYMLDIIHYSTVVYRI